MNDNITLDDIAALIMRTQQFMLLGFTDIYNVLRLEAQNSKRQDLVDYYTKRIEAFENFNSDMQDLLEPKD